MSMTPPRHGAWLSPFASPRGKWDASRSVRARLGATYTRMCDDDDACVPWGFSVSTFAEGEDHFGECHGAALVVQGDMVATLGAESPHTAAGFRAHVAGALDRAGCDTITRTALEYAGCVLDAWALVRGEVAGGCLPEHRACVARHMDAVFARTVGCAASASNPLRVVHAMGEALAACSAEASVDAALVAANVRVFDLATSAAWTHAGISVGAVAWCTHREASRMFMRLDTASVAEAVRGCAALVARHALPASFFLAAPAVGGSGGYTGMPHTNGRAAGWEPNAGMPFSERLDVITKAAESVHLGKPGVYLRHAQAGNTALARAVREAHRVFQTGGGAAAACRRRVKVMRNDPFGEAWIGAAIRQGSCDAVGQKFKGATFTQRIARWCDCPGGAGSACTAHPRAMRDDHATRFVRGAQTYAGARSLRWALVPAAAVGSKAFIFAVVRTVAHGQAVVLTTVDRKMHVLAVVGLAASLDDLARELEEASNAACGGGVDNGVYEHAVFGEFAGGVAPRLPARRGAAVVSTLTWHAALRACVGEAATSARPFLTWPRGTTVGAGAVSRDRDHAACLSALVTFAEEGAEADTHVLLAFACYVAGSKVPLTFATGNVHSAARVCAACALVA